MQILQEHFIALATQYHCNKSEALILWQELETHYTQPKRHYHNLTHIQHVVQELSKHQQHINDWNSILFAAFYHDIIYNATSSDNEEKSTKYASNILAHIQAPNHQIKRCIQHIIATKTHQFSNNNDTNYLIDADLCILGQPLETYQAYCKAIRKEYSVYPDFMYNPGRKKVLQHFLDMPQIFKTQAFIQLYENNARKNLQWELETL